MAQRAIPYVLEDRTGHPYGTDFDDAYDRLFLRVVDLAARSPLAPVQPVPLSSSPSRTSAPSAPPIRTLAIYDMPHRWSPRRASAHIDRAPAAVLRLGFGSDLGTVEFRLPQLVANVALSKWMPRTGYFAAQLSRNFVASNGRRYQWAYRTAPGHDWVCADAENGAVCAYYDARPPRGTSDHEHSRQALTVFEEYGAIAVELLCAFLVMRHIQIYQP